MATNKENVEKLAYAVTTLNNDAIGMHELIQKGSTHLEETIAIEKRASEDLETNAKALQEMVDLIPSKLDSIEDSFKSFEERSLKNAQEGRSEMQADLLNHKTAISARLDNLENEVVSLKSSIQGFDEKITQAKEEVKASMKPLLFLGVGVLAVELVAIVVSVLV